MSIFSEKETTHCQALKQAEKAGYKEGVEEGKKTMAFALRRAIFHYF